MCAEADTDAAGCFSSGNRIAICGLILQSGCGYIPPLVASDGAAALVPLDALPLGACQLPLIRPRLALALISGMRVIFNLGIESNTQLRSQHMLSHQQMQKQERDRTGHPRALPV